LESCVFRAASSSDSDSDSDAGKTEDWPVAGAVTRLECY
jgi:hypothetical protein